MFARIATFESTDPAADAKIMDEAGEIVMPIMRDLKGYRGHLELQDPSSGKSLSITLFDTEASALAAEPIFDAEMPRALGDLMRRFSGRRVSVERFNILVDDRAGTPVG